MKYLVIQYSDRPERFEFKNVGVLVYGPLIHTFKVLYSFNKLGGYAGVNLFNRYMDRVESNIDRQGVIDADRFNAETASCFRITSLEYVNGEDSETVAKELYETLVNYDGEAFA